MTLVMELSPTRYMLHLSSYQILIHIKILQNVSYTSLY